MTARRKYLKPSVSHGHIVAGCVGSGIVKLKFDFREEGKP
jgi:hypothetical protein